MNAPDTPAPTDLDFETRARLEQHLDAVEDVLRRYQQPRSTRNAIVDELENQIRESLAERVQDRAPTLDELNTLLTEMDPPEAYARNSIDLASLPSTFSFPGEDPPRFNRATAAGLIWIGWWALASMFLMTLIAIEVAPEVTSPNPNVYNPHINRVVEMQATHAYQTWWGVLIIIFLCIPGLIAPVATTILGWLGITQIQQSADEQYGIGFAAFNATFFPLLLTNAATLVLVGGIFTSMVQRSDTALLTLIIISLLTLALLVTIDRIAIRRVWNYAARLS
ncbi:MAG: hypothetical protein AAGH99_04595 [Planctomycetota bacterium]